MHYTYTANMLWVINKRFMYSSSKLGSLWFDLFHKSQPIWQWNRRYDAVWHRGSHRASYPQLSSLTQGKDACFSLLWHVTPCDLYRAKTVIQYGVTPATTPPSLLLLSHHTFQIPQRWPHAGCLSAAHSQGGDLLPASRPGAVQSGTELHCQEGGAMERLQWGEAQGKHLTTLQPLLSLQTMLFSSNPRRLIGLMDVFLTREWAKRSLILIC